MIHRTIAIACSLTILASLIGCGDEPTDAPPAETRPRETEMRPAPDGEPADDAEPTPAPDGEPNVDGEPAPAPDVGEPGRETPPAATQPVAGPVVDAQHRERAQELIDNGIAYLLSQREDDGGWSIGGAVRPAATAIVLKALVQHGDYDADSPVVKQGFDVLLDYQQDNGGIYDPEQGYQNYTTSLAVMAMAAAEAPRFNEPTRDAVRFLKGVQIVPGSESPDGDPIPTDHPFVGGVSYGKHGRPDGSNAGMWAQALHDAGVPPDDEAMQRVLGFFTRMQNRSESNPMPWAAEGPNDGGFVYAPALKDNPTMGESKAGTGPGGRGLRSYGSLTYVGFKTLLYAGLDRRDPRVRAARQWIGRHWRLDSNPNMPQARSLQGLYYYYHVFAKALRAWGEPTIEDAEGVRHNWREELIDALAERVSENGSWVNDADRWNEGSPVLVTGYSVLALQEAMKGVGE